MVGLGPMQVAARESQPSRLVVKLEQGEAALKEQRFADARRHFRQALEVEPDCATAYHGLGLALAGLKDYREAALAFQQAVRLSPPGGRPFSTSGWPATSWGSGGLPRRRGKRPGHWSRRALRSSITWVWWRAGRGATRQPGRPLSTPWP